MAGFLGAKNRLAINLSLFTFSDQNSNSSKKPHAKSLKRFEPKNGVVGLGIVAAMNELDQNQDQFLNPKCRRATAKFPKSNPISIVTVTNCCSPAAEFNGRGSNLGEQLEFSEDYTCVISHIGNNVIEKREYFNECSDNGFENPTSHSRPCLGSKPFSIGFGADAAKMAAFQRDYFLDFCHLCKKGLEGLDIFMYRGDKAFCSAECRYKQISIDEHREKFGSGAMEPLGYSISPCSGPMQFFTGVAAA